MLLDLIITYLIFISVFAVIVTVYDKILAITNKRRIPERTLMIVSVLGGSLAMYLTMQLIRHKTRKTKFMVGLPIVILLQVALIIVSMVML